MSSKDLKRAVEMIHGYRQTCLVMAAIESGLLDRLEEGAASTETLVKELSLDLDATSRFLWALRSAELVSQDEDRRWILAGPGRYLGKEGFGAGLRAWAELVGGEYYRAWGRLGESLKSGETAFDTEFGMSVWEHRRRNPGLNSAFQKMASGEQRRTLSRLLRAYQFPANSCLVDVGGGEGILLNGILKKYPESRGILFDLPQVIEGLTGEEFEVVGGSFLEQVPPSGDILMLKHVLHNWSDADCLTILSNCRKALNTDGKILILENLLNYDDEAHVMMDIHMLAVLGGRERGEDEYIQLLREAGLELADITFLAPGLPVVMEAKPSV